MGYWRNETMKKLTPKEKLIARLKSEGVIPSDHEIHIEVMRWSTYRREMQWLPRIVLLVYRPGHRLPEEIHSDQTVTELSRARRLVLWGVGKQEYPDLVGENSELL